ncbi:FAD/FMN-containing dehydrogenase [Loktanella fryxellensis]|uniref:FAD/FMN-containing dehydrogenase n=1 Tax=Loktanella fryxellensis TaxID=245187 RepID=A0A1H8AWV2_9RHOB|nr:FAD-binding oxidoreductase [Loktanella fryxellensis]SEM74319.1 FAD/FMN-containing dehydrogenase [Loktanella fryxellensis]
MTLLETLAPLLGPGALLTDPVDMAPWVRDWTGRYVSTPLAVARPATTAQVSAVVAACHATGTPVVPVSGHTGLNGGASAMGGLVLSLDRLCAIRDIDAAARTATVEAGVILSRLHDAAADHDLIFPLTFGARGSAMIGGVLSTNAGGSNVLRYGNTRDLVLGLTAVMADGRVMDLSGRLHKDNSGLNLKHLLIGAEGSLGIITAATVKLFQRPRAYATAMVAAASLPAALTLLHRMQDATGGAVEAFEYMPATYIARHLAVIAGAKAPFAHPHDVNILIEVGATAPRDATPLADGSLPVVALLQDTLAQMMDEGLVLDAVVAQTEAQRRTMWARREAAAEVMFAMQPFVDTDVALALPDVATFMAEAKRRLLILDPAATDIAVAHLGDGNVHYTACPSRDDPALIAAIREMVEDVVQDLSGSFSAEHGIGLSKLGSMTRRKDPVALDAMRAIKAALDPHNILNPGKTIPQ